MAAEAPKKDILALADALQSILDVKQRALIVHHILEAISDVPEALLAAYFEQQNGCDLTTALCKALMYGNPLCVQMLLNRGADVNKVKSTGRTALCWAADCENKLKLLMNSRADVDVINPLSLVWIDIHEANIEHYYAAYKTEAVIKQLLAAGANVNVVGQHVRYILPAEIIPDCYNLLLLTFAAGEHHVEVSERNNGTPTRFFPHDLHDLDLKNQCRKVIRKHLLTLDPHTNLFIRVPQLQMTNERAGLPEKLVSYLLYDQNLDIDWKQILDAPNRSLESSDNNSSYSAWSADDYSIPSTS